MKQYEVSRIVKVQKMNCQSFTNCKIVKTIKVEELFVEDMVFDHVEYVSRLRGQSPLGNSGGPWNTVWIIGPNRAPKAWDNYGVDTTSSFKSQFFAGELKTNQPESQCSFLMSPAHASLSQRRHTCFSTIYVCKESSTGKACTHKMLKVASRRNE